MESRLTPASRKPRNFACSKVPGLASRVISASGSTVRSVRAAVRMRSMACAEKRLGVPPPTKIACTRRPHTRVRRLEVGDDRIDVARLRHLAPRLVRIEVAIGAFLQAPGHVHVERERRQRREAHAPRGGDGDRACGRHQSAPRRRATRRAAAMARWLRRFFSGAGSSAAVRFRSGTRKYGS